MNRLLCSLSFLSHKSEGACETHDPFLAGAATVISILTSQQIVFVQPVKNHEQRAGSCVFPGSCVLASRLIQGERINARISAELTDSVWDDFLRANPAGQFQQSSLWAQYKGYEGWKCIRVILDREGEVVGGFQTLWRETRFGRIGNVSKGPVLTPDNAELESFALDVLLEVSRSSRLTAIVVQPPDHIHSLATALQNRGFDLNRLMDIFDATLWVDLSGPPGEWEAKLRKVTRKNVRKSMRLGVKVHEGGNSDIPAFFDLMQSSCERQGVRPNPSTLEKMIQLARAFNDADASRLTFAVWKGEIVAGVFGLIFGKRFTSWKKGWNGKCREQKPNVLLTYDSMRKACDLGCTCFDFAMIETPLAKALLNHQPLTEEQMNHYDSYKLGFGGQPQLLPPAMIYFVNPILRFAHGQVMAWPWAGRRLTRLAGRL